MKKFYQHTQIGYLLIILFIVIIYLLIYLMSVSGFNWIGLLVLLMFGVCLLLFATLTVSITEEILEIRFGIGLIRKRFSVKEIESCWIVRNPWYYGWGIRLTPHGWLYNVSSFYAVEIKMTTGKKYRIGTDVPSELQKAIEQHIVVR